MRSVILPLLVLTSGSVTAQENRRLISGLVIADESSAPVESVTVKVKGTDKISGTQADGTFTFSDPATGLASAAGYSIWSVRQEEGKPLVVEGVIYHDKNKNPVDKAYVFITEGEEEYLTSSNGYFKIETWQKLPLQLSVKHDGKPASRYKVTDPGARQVILLR